MADIFQEVDEELRHERYAKLWKKYGGYVIAVGVAIVLAVAGTMAWREYQRSAREAESIAFATATASLEAGNEAAAVEAFARLAADTSSGYATLARLKQAEALRRIGDTEGAVAAYDALAANTSADPIYRDLATVLRAYLTLDDADPQALAGRLEAVAEDGNPWRHSARELLALLALRQGESARARERLTQLTDDSEAPAGIRARASELLSSLDG